MEKQHKYKAFISYSHQDQKFAKWLHREIENYKIPRSLREKYSDLPKDLQRSIFIDDEELPIAAALPDNLSHALESSEILIVVCSPSVTESYWVDKEIAYFKQYHGEDRVLAILKEGEPNATYSTIYDNTLEAFPKSLRYKVDKSGEPTEERTEPLAADARKRSTRKKALLKLIAGILKVDFADLWEREKREARKRWTISGALLTLFVAMGIYASVHYAGEQGNKELERITAQIATIEYSIRHDELPMEKKIALNKELKKLKQDKENKEASIEALGKLKTSLGKKAQKVYDQKGAEAAIEVLTSRSTLADQEHRLKEISKEILALAKVYVEIYRFDEAKESYQKALDLFFDYENAILYGIFLSDNNHFGEAIELFEKLKKINFTESQKAKIFNNLGVLYWKINRFKEAEILYLETVKIQRFLVKNNPDDYNPDLATSLQNLGLLYKDTNRFKEAEEQFLKALKIQKLLTKTNPDDYNPDLARTLYNLGLLYGRTDRFKEAEEQFLKALKIQNLLVKTSPDDYNPDLATMISSLADLYRYTNRLNDAEEIYIEVLKIQRSLAKNNPDAYSPDLSTTLNNLSLLYKDTNRFKEAEILYLETLNIQRSLAKNNPETNVFNSKLAYTLNDLGLLYFETNRFKEAEELYLEALKIQRTLAKNNPDTHNPYLTSTLVYLGVIYDKANKLKEAEELYLEAIKTEKVVVKNNPEAHGSNFLKSILNTLADFYRDTNRSEEAIRIEQELLEVR